MTRQDAFVCVFVCVLLFLNLHTYASDKTEDRTDLCQDSKNILTD